MNNSFTELDGKPAVLMPEHVNLGIAIDLVGKEGARSLVVASIKGGEGMNFSAFWTAYEDIIRRARANKLTIEDFAGTTISLTNPGTIGTEPFRSATHGGPRHDRRRRRDGIPGRVQRHERGPARRATRSARS